MKLTDEIKEKIVTQLKVLDPYKIIIFGSHAYGEPNENSDLDICVVEKDYENKFEDKKKIRKLLKNINIAKDILNPKIDEYEFYKEEINSVYYDIDKKGMLLWSS